MPTSDDEAISTSDELVSEIRRAVAEGKAHVTMHARVEGMKDGIMIRDIVAVMASGDLIEDYRPERNECLLLGYTAADHLPVHVPVNFENWDSVRAKTCYIPQPDQWQGDRIRKRR